MTAAEANAHPERLPFNLSPITSAADRRRRCGRTAIARHRARWSSSEGDAAWAEIVRALRRVLALRVPASQGLQRGRDRVLRGHELRRERTCTTRSSRSCARTSAARTSTCRTIVGGMDRLPNAFYARAAGRGPLRRRGARDRPGRRRRDACTTRPRPDRVTVRAATTRSARCRSRCCGRSRHDRSRARSSAPSASSTTTPRPRSCSRCATGSGRRRTASSAARRSPTCRSGA